LPDWEEIVIKNSRIVRLTGDIDEDQRSVGYDISQLGRDSREPITLIIDSRGGDESVMKAIVSAIRFSSAPVHGLVEGQAMSAAFIILQNCAKRLARPNTELLLHAPRITAQTISAFTTFPAYDDVVFDDDDEYRSTMKHLASRSGQPLEQIEAWSNEERVFTAEQALQCGLLDEVVNT
jgi:ATP-dependent Clp protease protease subunit